MHYLNEYYKSHIYESIAYKEKNTLNKKCALQDRVLQTETRADFLERIVRALRGFTVSFRELQVIMKCCIVSSPSLLILHILLRFCQ